MTTRIHPRHQDNRHALVQRLLANTPLAYSLTERESLAVILEKSSNEWRTSFASTVGADLPSPETWADFVAAIRCRPLASVEEIRAARRAS